MMRLVRRSCRWFLRNRRAKLPMLETIAEFSNPVSKLYRKFSQLLIGNDKRRVVAKLDDILAHKVPEDLASKIAHSGPMYHSLNIVQASLEQGVDLQQVAKVYFILEDRLDLLWFRGVINEYPVDNRWAVLAKASFKGDLDWIQRSLTSSVLKFRSDARQTLAKIEQWSENHQALIGRWQNIAANIRGTDGLEFDILSVALRELLDLAQTSVQWNQTNDRAVDEV